MTDRPDENTLTEVDKAASAACTRSGAFALILTVTLSLLITNWIQRKDELAFANYTNYRLVLANQIENLDQNPLWKTYTTQHDNVDSMTIRQLMSAKLEFPQPQQPQQAQQPKAPPKVKKQPKLKSDVLSPPTLSIIQPKEQPKGKLEVGPSPTLSVAQPKAKEQTKAKLEAAPTPTNLRVSIVSSLDDITQPITDLLNKLNDSELLTHSRRVSNFYSYSVGRWAVKRDNLIYRNMIDTTCFKKVQWELGPKTSDDFVPLVDKDAMLDCLTLRDVKELASYELPAFSNQLIEGRIQRDVDVNPSSLIPRDLYLASFLIQLLLLFVIVHFVAYAREAVSSDVFPAKGTLFSAFAGSPGTLLVFLVALWSPLAASVAIAIVSRKWPLVSCSLLIGITVWSIHLVLHRKAFFKSLNPRLLLRQTPEPNSSSI